MISSLSVWRRYKFVWKKGVLFLVFFLAVDGKNIKLYKLFLAAASEDKIGFSNDFLLLLATPCEKFLEL